MPIIDESQLDSASSGTMVDASQLDGSKKETGEQIARRKYPKLFEAQPENVVRERQTFGGEVAGGIQGIIEGVGNAVKEPSRMLDPIAALLKGITGDPLGAAKQLISSPQGEVLTGAARAATPLVTLGASPHIMNAAATAGETVSELTPDVPLPGGFNLKDVTGGLTQSAIDVVPTALLDKGTRAVGAKLATKLPSRAERIKTLGKEEAAQEALINAKAESARRQAIKARQDAEAAAAKARTEVPTAAKAESLTSTKSTSEEIGAGLRKHYEDTHIAKAAEKDALYNPLLDEGSKVTGSRGGYDASIKTVLGEKGLSGTPATQAEKIAKGASKTGIVVDEAAIADQIDALEAQMKNSPTAEAQKMAKGALEEFVKSGDVPSNPTVADLILEQKRINAALGASRNDNLSRQLRLLKDGVDADIKGSSKSIYEGLTKADKFYAEEYAPLFGRKSEIRSAFDKGDSAIIDQLVPKASDALRDEKIARLAKFVSNPEQQKALGDGLLKNIVGDASKAGDDLFGSRLKGVWNRYADPRSGDKVLKSVLGERYDGMKQLVEQTKAIKPKSIDDGLKAALKNYDELLGRGSRKVGDLEISSTPGAIDRERLKQIDVMKKDIKAKADKLGVKELPPHGGQLVGSAMILHGAVGAAVGSPVALGQIIAGVGVMIAAPGLMKLTNTARGLELLNKSIKAAPGTTRAFANARVLLEYLKKPEDEE